MYKRGAKANKPDDNSARRMRTASNSPPGKSRGDNALASRDKVWPGHTAPSKKGHTTARSKEVGKGTSVERAREQACAKAQACSRARSTERSVPAGLGLSAGALTEPDIKGPPTVGTARVTQSLPVTGTVEGPSSDTASAGKCSVAPAKCHSQTSADKGLPLEGSTTKPVNSGANLSVEEPASKPSYHSGSSADQSVSKPSCIANLSGGQSVSKLSEDVSKEYCDSKQDVPTGEGFEGFCDSKPTGKLPGQVYTADYKEYFESNPASSFRGHSLVPPNAKESSGGEDSASELLCEPDAEEVFTEGSACDDDEDYAASGGGSGDLVHSAITEVSEEVSEAEVTTGDRGEAVAALKGDIICASSVARAVAASLLRRSRSGSPQSSRTQERGRRHSGSAALTKTSPHPNPDPHHSSPSSTVQQRRGSSVTFNLPAHVSTSDESSSSYSRRQSNPCFCQDSAASIYDRFSSLYSRRMSAPELPPIADRERPRPASRSTSKSSLNQLTAAVSSKTFYTRLTTGGKLPRNHSDSSLKGLLTGSASHHKSSGSVSSYLSAGGALTNTPGSAADPLLPPTQPLRSASRALSWCATDNSTGSIPRLETLFERKLASDSDIIDTSTPLASKDNTNYNNNNNNSLTTNNNMIPPRSVSVNGIRRDSQEQPSSPTPVPKGNRGRRKRLQSDCGAVEENVGTIEQFGRMRLNGMKRSSSENKLDKKNIRNARLSSNRYLSVSRNDKLAYTRSPSRNAPPRSNASVNMRTGGGGMRRVNSVAAINVASNRASRLGSVFQDGNDVDGGSGDSEEEEERSSRIREWLVGLEFADVPPDPVIEYADDPPQTDTAVHIVYGDD